MKRETLFSSYVDEPRQKQLVTQQIFVTAIDFTESIWFGWLLNLSLARKRLEKAEMCANTLDFIPEYL